MNRNNLMKPAAQDCISGGHSFQQARFDEAQEKTTQFSGCQSLCMADMNRLRNGDGHSPPG